MLRGSEGLFVGLRPIRRLSKRRRHTETVLPKRALYMATKKLLKIRRLLPARRPAANSLRSPQLRGHLLRLQQAVCSFLREPKDHRTFEPRRTEVFAFHRVLVARKAVFASRQRKQTSLAHMSKLWRQPVSLDSSCFLLKCGLE